MIKSIKSTGVVTCFWMALYHGVSLVFSSRRSSYAVTLIRRVTSLDFRPRSLSCIASSLSKNHTLTTSQCPNLVMHRMKKLMIPRLLQGQRWPLPIIAFRLGADKTPGRGGIALPAARVEEVPKGIPGHFALHGRRIVYDWSVGNLLLDFLLQVHSPGWVATPGTSAIWVGSWRRNPPETFYAGIKVRR